jgi:ectoine hydroxylase-related dioxygenase (phytanoyl-CoA dioxygenase family)
MNLSKHLVRATRDAAAASPLLYDWFYSLLTMNRNYLRLRMKRGKYFSKFGGFWTDRTDYEDILRDKLKTGRIAESQRELFNHWREHGFVIFNQCVDMNVVNQMILELQDLPLNAPAGLKITGGDEMIDRDYKPESVKAHDSIRIVDFYHFSESARRLLFNSVVVEFLHQIFENDPVLTQSLSFEFGSEQEVHQDTAFVIMNSPMMFAGVWIALEDVQDSSGELLYYAGSHRWGDFLFSKRFKHWQRERDGDAQIEEWQTWIHAEAKRRRTPLTKFKAKKGDVLIWHAGLAHGGAPILDSRQTRRSLVGHFCPSDVRPLYHYLKPESKKYYDWMNFQYTTQYY